MSKTPAHVRRAIDIYLTSQPIVDALSRDLEDAKDVIKAHFRAKHPLSLHGITYSSVPYNRLDVAAARLLLGPRKAAACTVTATRETLTLPPHLRRGAIDLSGVLDRTA